MALFQVLFDLSLLWVCTKSDIPSRDSAFLGDFVQFFQPYFRLSKYVDVTILDELEMVVSLEEMLQFANWLVLNVVGLNAAATLHVKNLHIIDIKLEPKLQSFINETFILDYNISLNQSPPHIVYSKTPYVKDTKAQDLRRIRRSCCELEHTQILISPSLQSLDTFLNGSYQVSPHKRRSVHLIFVVGDAPINLELLSQVLYRIWVNFHILNAVFWPLNSEVFYIYRPFHRTEHSWGVVTVHDLAQANMLLFLNSLTDLERLPLRIKIFERDPTVVAQIPRSLADNSIYLELYKFSQFLGVDGCVLGEIAKQMNFTVLLVNKKQRNFGKVLKEGYVTGSLGYAVYDLVDLVANGMFVTDQFVSNYEFTTPYFNDDICMVVPKAERVPQWLGIFKCFQLETWAFLLTTCVICLVYWYLYGGFTRQRQILAVICILVSAPIKLKHRNVFLASCMIFNAVVIWVFQGNLVKSYSTISYYSDINTLEDLDESGFPVSTSLTVFNYYENSSLIKRLHDKTIHLTLSMQEAAFHKNVAALERRKDAQQSIRSFTSDGIPLLHLSKSSVISFYMSFVVPQGSAYLHRFNVLLSHFVEHGFVLKWYNDMAYTITMTKMFQNPEGESAQKVFSVYDVQAAFLIWGFGIILAILVFCLELIVAKIVTKPVLYPYAE